MIIFLTRKNGDSLRLQADKIVGYAPITYGKTPDGPRSTVYMGGGVEFDVRESPKMLDYLMSKAGYILDGVFPEYPAEEERENLRYLETREGKKS